MDHKQKYLKYKQKYINLKKIIGGKICEICPKKGFIQHSGECWHDAFSMILLYTDDLSDDIHELFNKWLSDETLINSYVESMFESYDARKYLLSPNIDYFDDNIKLNIKDYIFNLFRRYKRELEYQKSDLTKETKKLYKQESQEFSLNCIKKSFYLNKINMSQKYAIYPDFDAGHGGRSDYNYLNKSIINFMFAKTKKIQMIHISIKDLINKRDFDLIKIQKLIKSCKCLQIDLRLDQIADIHSYHSFGFFVCNNESIFYDDNIGELFPDRISIRYIDWKSILLQYFQSYDTLININDIFTTCCAYYKDYPYKDITAMTFYYLDDLDSNDYYYTPGIHCLFENKQSIDYWNNKLIDIMTGKNSYFNLYEELNKFSLAPQILDILLDYNYEFDINLYNHLEIAIENNNIKKFNKILRYPTLDINKYDIVVEMCNRNNTDIIKILLLHPQLNLSKEHDRNAPILYLIANKNIEIIKLFINDPRYNIYLIHNFGTILHALISYIELNDISKDIISRGIDINVKDFNDMLAIHNAMFNNNKEIFDILYDIYLTYDKNILVDLFINIYSIDINDEIFDDKFSDDIELKKTEINYYINKIKKLI